MALVKQGGTVTTTMGIRNRRGERCGRCGQFSKDLMTVNANGQRVCSDCASPKERVVLTQCDGDNCACGEVQRDELDPA